VVDFNSKERNYALIDPIRETFGWNPESSVLYNYSGYVLVPKYPTARKWNTLAGLSLLICGLGCLILFWRHGYYSIASKKTVKERKDDGAQASL
jgi:hypothetical protein